MPTPEASNGEPSLYVGIDGGGTRTTAVLTDQNGRELARVVAGPALVDSNEPDAGAAFLAELTKSVLRRADAPPPAYALCCALAGAGRAPQRDALLGALKTFGVAVIVNITTDAEAALHDAFRDGPGMLLIAGTGSIAWGRAEDGRVARVGGWGALLGDEGSGFRIGLAALRAVARAHDGRGPNTALTHLVLQHAEVAEPQHLIAWAEHAGKARIAAIAPLLLASAAKDRTSARIARNASRELAAHLQALSEQLQPRQQPVRLALAGGLLQPGSQLRRLLCDRLLRSPIRFDVLDTCVDAARGAACLARRLRR